MALEPRPSGEALSSRPGRLPGVILVGAWLLVASVHLVLRPERRLLVWPLGYLLLEALALTPSELLGRFADFLETHSEPDTTALQTAFFATCFREPERAALAADLVTYFGRSGELLEAMALEPGGPRSCVAAFHHDPWLLLEHLEAGITDLESLAALLPGRPCRAHLCGEGGEVHLRVLEAGVADTLEGLPFGGSA